VPALPNSTTPVARGRLRRPLLVVAVALAALLGGGLVAPAATAAVPTVARTAAKPPAPKTVKVAKNSFGKLQLKWSKSKTAKGYRVIVATDKKMKKVVLRTKYTTKRAQWISGKKIKEGTRYYVQVQSYKSKAKPGKKSKVKAVRPLTKPVKKPLSIAVKGAGLNAVTVTWKPAKDATGYTVKLRATKTGAPFQTKRVTGKSKKALTLTGINTAARGHAFFVTVTADRYKRTTRDSDTIIGATSAPYEGGAARVTGVKVGSYNVWAPTSEADWNNRGRQMANLVSDRDIVGIQELTYGRQNWNGTPRPIFEFARLSGLNYPYNSRQEPCSVNSVHILHSDKFWLQDCGSSELAPRSSRSATTDKKPRYVVWSVLQDGSGNSVLAVNTHLSNGSKAADNSLRVAQARDLVAVVNRVNTRKLPVILLGDLNSFYGRATQAPMDELHNARYLAADLFAAKVTNGKYASTVDKGKTATNGLRIDHIFTSRNVRIDEFSVRYTGSPPSDHHPVFATLSLLG